MAPCTPTGFCFTGSPVLLGPYLLHFYNSSWPPVSIFLLSKCFLPEVLGHTLYWSHISPLATSAREEICSVHSLKHILQCLRHGGPPTHLLNEPRFSCSLITHLAITERSTAGSVLFCSARCCAVPWSGYTEVLTHWCYTAEKMEAQNQRLQAGTLWSPMFLLLLFCLCWFPHCSNVACHMSCAHQDCLLLLQT